MMLNRWRKKGSFFANLEGLDLQRVYWVLFGLFIVNKLIVYFLFSTLYFDQDQTTMWLATEEMSKGHFHEPCFWGQPYNTMLESLFAVPLNLLGMKASYSLPLITMCMASFPYLWGSRLVFKYKNQKLGLILLIVPLITTVDYDLLMGMSRGWVTGQFIASFAFWSFVHPQKRLGWVLFGFSASLALWVNANAIFLLFIIAYFLLLENYKNFRFYAFGLIGAIVPVLWVIFSLNFYREHPDYSLHPPPSFGFSVSLILEALPRLDVFFGYVGPFARFGGWLSLFCIPILITVLFVKRNLKYGVLHLVLFIGIVASLSMEKTSDAMGTLFFSGGRFFIGYPFILAFLTFSLIEVKSFKLNMKVVIIIIAVMTVARISKLFYRYGNIELVGRKHWVSVEHIDDLQKSCEEIKDITEAFNISLVVFRSDPDQLLTYGCPCLVDDFPETFFTWYERRTWLTKNLDTTIHKNILLINPSEENSSGTRLYIDEGIKCPWGIIIENNDIPVNTKLEHLGYIIRPH